MLGFQFAISGVGHGPFSSYKRLWFRHFERTLHSRKTPESYSETHAIVSSVVHDAFHSTKGKEPSSMGGAGPVPLSAE